MDATLRNLPKLSVALDCGTPLWKIVPLRDEHGRPLSDFMMIVPGLCKKTQPVIENTLQALHRALLQYGEVVFAHFNLPTNLLWVSLKNRPGLTLAIATAIREMVPEAVLVGMKRDWR